MESGRCILANAFIDRLITFINKLTLPENTHTQKPEYNRSSLIDVYREPCNKISYHFLGIK